MALSMEYNPSTGEMTGDVGRALSYPAIKGEVLQSEIARAEKEKHDYVKKYEEETSSAAKKELEALRKNRAETESALQKIGPQPSVPEQMEMPKPTSLEELPAMFSIMATIGALAGAATKGPMNASLNNLTGILEGVKEGDTARMNREFAMMKQNHQVAQDKIRAHKEAIEAVLKKSGGDSKYLEEEARLELQAKGIDPKLLDMYMKAPGELYKHADSLSKSETKLKEVEAKIERYRDQSWADRRRLEIRDRQVAAQEALSKAKQEEINFRKGAKLDEASLSKAAEEIVTTGKKTLADLYIPKGASGAADRAALALKVTEEMQKRGMSGADVATKAMEATSTQQEINLIAKRVGSLQAQTQSLHNNFDLLLKVYDGEVGPTDVNEATSLVKKYFKSTDPKDYGDLTKINQFANWVGQQTNNPRAIEYAAAVNAVAMDYARVMSGPASGAMLPEGARRKAMEIFNVGYDRKALEGLREVMEREAQGQIDGWQSAIGKATAKLSGQAEKSTVETYGDPEKERRYQEWKAKHGG